ncbi:MAG: carbonic anhydrase [Pseudomonadota bacterium]
MNTKAKESLGVLMDGNEKFVGGRLAHPRHGVQHRKETAPAQYPIAVIVSCSDSRVPPEIIFDQGIGDLFVVRVAGNVLDDIGLGSVEYAAEHLNVPLVMVLGHKRCGAVTAAVEGGKAPGRIQSIVEAIAPAVEEAKRRSGGADLVESACRINIERTVEALKNSGPILSRLVKEGKLSVVGACYDLDSGRVELTYVHPASVVTSKAPVVGS